MSLSSLSPLALLYRDKGFFLTLEPLIWGVICKHCKNANVKRVLEFNDYNGGLFNIRARSLNNLVYWLAQIVGSLSIGFLLDQKALSRRLRAFSGWLVLFFMVFVVHIWTYFYLRGYTRESIKSMEKIDIYDKEYVGRVMLYICCGMLDAMWQTCAYWFMGAMSNDPAKLAHFSGFCECLFFSISVISFSLHFRIHSSCLSLVFDY